jgi:hypothetical protein
MMTATALLHREFRMLLVNLSEQGATPIERELATLTLSLYDADPEHPAVVHIVNQFTRRALDAA